MQIVKTLESHLTVSGESGRGSVAEGEGEPFLEQEATPWHVSGTTVYVHI